MSLESSICVKSCTKDYPIYFGSIERNLDKLLLATKDTRLFCVTDQNVADNHLDLILEILSIDNVDSYILPAGEKSKSVALLEEVAGYLLERKYTKKTTIIALGGGMVGDFVGLLAALYFRGINYIQMPTTLLSMVDSSIGGKTAVNHTLGKNILGVIYPPTAIFMDTSFLSTLSNREYISGISEVVKYGLLFDSRFFNWIEKQVDLILQRDPIVLSSLIESCCSYKANIVENDEYEAGDRMLLNLGHTLAHALESVTNYSLLLHGEAVAIGLVFASKISNLLGIIGSQDMKRIECLLEKFGLPVRIANNLSKEKVINSMLLDKKNYHRSLRMVLLDNIGCGKIYDKVPLDMVKQVLSEVGVKQ